MKFQHKTLSQGRWNNLSLMAQMANVGSEVSRSINWRQKGKKDLSNNSLFRSLELLFLTINDPKNKNRLKEITRVHELLVDDFLNGNTYASKDSLWQNYFLGFAIASKLSSNKPSE